jgi:tetratricopeptide (TPR) repeat protein
MTNRIVGMLVVCLGLALASPAAAQDMEAAKKHYLAGKTAQKEAKYDVAVKEFIAAYEITKDASLFKQIAASYESWGKKEEAAIYYRRYLAEAKSPADGDAIKAKVAELEGKPVTPPSGGGDVGSPTGPVEDDLGPGPEGDDKDKAMDLDLGGGDTTPAGGGAPPPAFIDEPSRWQRTAAWISVGVAAVALTTGAVLATSSLSREDDIKRLLVHDPVTGLPEAYQGSIAEDYEDARSEGESLKSYALYSFIAAGVAAGAATAFFILDSMHKPKQSEQTVRFTPIVTPDTAGVYAGWSF